MNTRTTRCRTSINPSTTSTRMHLPAMSLSLSVLLVLLVACCGGSVSEASARSAINVMTDTVDTSYALAMQGCQDLEGEAMTEGETGKRSAVDTETAIASISARCHKVRDAFEEIRAFHEQAIVFANGGQYEQALYAIQKVREAWQTLRERTDTP